MALNQHPLVFTVPPVVFTVALVVLRPAKWDLIRVTGLLLTFFGIGLWAIARAQLGNSFSVTPQARALVTTGLYSRIRNPVYLFGATCLAGFAMYVSKPKLLLLLLMLIPIQVLRAQAEGKKLEERFGEDYREWKRRTWF